MWNDYQHQYEKIDYYENEESKNQETLFTLQNQMEQEECHFQMVYEEYIEEYYRYSEENNVLKLSLDDLNLMQSILMDYEETRNYLAVRKIVENLYETLVKENMQDQAHLVTEIDRMDQQLRELNKEKDRLEALSDLEPEKRLSSVLNRQFLTESGICYRPLYQLLDFDEHMPVEKRNRIEELLSNMQLLDALVVNEKYKNQVLNFPSGCQDYYLWTSKEAEDLSTVVISQFDNQEDFDHLLVELGINKETNIMIQEKYFKSGIIEGSVSLQKEAIYIGYESRLKAKQDKIEALVQEITTLTEAYDLSIKKQDELKQELNQLKLEYEAFPNETKLKEALDQVDGLRKNCAFIEENIKNIQTKIVMERNKLQTISHQLQEISNKLMISSKREVFDSYKEDLEDYLDYYESYKDDFMVMMDKIRIKNIEEEQKNQLEEDLDELKAECDDLQYKLDVALQEKSTLQKKLDESGYKDIALQLETLQYEIERLENENREIDKHISVLETRQEQIDIDIQNTTQDKEKQYEKVCLYKDIFDQEKEYRFIIKEDLNDKELTATLKDLMRSLGNKKNINEYQTQLQHVYFEQNPYLNQYNIVQEKAELCHEVEDISTRLLLKATSQGKRISFLELMDILKQNIEMQELLIVDEDRHIFEEILVNTIGKKIRERIQTSRQWVDKIQDYMNDMNTSSGLQLSIRWKSKKAIDDEQLDTQKLVELLEIDYHILKDSDRKKISNHFRSKINEARKLSLDENTTASFHQLMKEVMDYRKWFDFTLYAKKPNESRKELTSHIFYAYSGGEKALSMYVPLFSAVAAKFESARKDAPLLIALDEAFAGVDENNIDNMFALITKFGFDYIMNSQVLWGDYPSCRSLAIYELFRPNNDPFVTVIPYIWNGHVRKLKTS